MEVNTNQLAKYQSYAYIEGTIQLSKQYSIPDTLIRYGNLEIQSMEHVVEFTYENNECVYISELESTGIVEFLKSLIRYESNQWIKIEKYESIKNLMEAIENTNSIISYSVIDKEVIVDGPGSNVKIYTYKDQTLTKNTINSYSLDMDLFEQIEKTENSEIFHKIKDNL